MTKKNQLADLRRLISLSPKNLRINLSKYIYESPETVLKMLFRLMKTEPLNDRKKDNIFTLARMLIEENINYPLPQWLIDELGYFLKSKRFTEIDKAILLSVFEPEELVDSVDGFDMFVEELINTKERFGDFIINQLRTGPSRLLELYSVITEKSRPEGLIAMIDDLTGYEDVEVIRLLELFCYHPDSMIAMTALRAIEMAGTQEAIETLYCIAALNEQLREEAEDAYINLMHELPLPREGIKKRKDPQDKKYIDLWITLSDGNGALSAFIGKRYGRNNYFFASILMKHNTGIKDVIIIPGISREGYEEIKENYFTGEIRFYPVQEDYLIKIVKHFLKINIQKGFPVPLELIVLKNILEWGVLEPVEYSFDTELAKPVKYYPRDLFKFPFDTWWLHDERLYRLLKPYKGLQVFEIPEGIFIRITEIFMEYARQEIVPLCELCADIIKNSKYKRRVRLQQLFLTIRNEILNPPEKIFDSTFLNFGIVASINNTLHNLSLGIESPEHIE
ncbi:MAG: hypothetical protein GXO97_02870 [Nitrospirae bacterium]|nr:hypothetical protein [Nitrospirota bacterium]